MEISTSTPVQAIPKPPENHTAALLNHNKLDRFARTTLALAWHGKTAEVSPNEYNDILSDEYLHVDFWENGAVAPLPHFSKIIDEAEEQPELFTRQMVADASTYMAPLTPEYSHCLTNRYSLQESDALMQLDSFLDFVVAESTDDNDEIFNLAVGLKEQLGYLDETRFEVGVQALAKIWTEYLKDNPEAYINIVRRQHIKQPKSFEYVLEKIKDSVATLDLGAALRVIDFAEGWKDTPGSKLIVLDDWVISGQTATKMVTEALKQIEQYKLYKLKDSIEVHSIAREASAEKIPGVAYHSIYLHDSGTNYDIVSLTGSHSSVNYGFEYSLRKMQKYLQAKGIFVPSPILMNTEPTAYRSTLITSEMEHDANGDKLREVSEQNLQALNIFSEIFRLRKIIFKLQKDRQQDHNKDTQLRRNMERMLDKEVLLKELSTARKSLREKVGFKSERV